MTFRDPRGDPQPGDILCGSGQTRRIVVRTDSKVLVDGGFSRYWMRVERWRAWCEKNAVVAMATPETEKTGTAGAPQVPAGAALRRP
jgi:hypothetical protein